MKLESTVCTKCAQTINKEGHPKNWLPVSEEEVDMIYHLRGCCCVCEAKISIKTMREQGFENWRRLAWTSAFFCPSCSHLIEASVK